MEDTKILESFNVLAKYIRALGELKVSPNQDKHSVAQSIHTRLHVIKKSCHAAGVSFNASEQNLSLMQAQKELDLLISDFLTAREAGVVTASQYSDLKKYASLLDEVIRSMSDPEYS